MTEGAPRPGVFLDRDGTIIVDQDYLSDPDRVVLLPGAAGAVARLNRAGLAVIVVTNQSGIGRGLFTEAQYETVNARFLRALEEEGARVDGVYHCPHGPDEPRACECRKPAPGMFRRAAAEHRLDLAASYFVGDRTRDVLVALEVGGVGILLPRPPGADPETAPPGILRVGSLVEAVDRILQAPTIDPK